MSAQTAPLPSTAHCAMREMFEDEANPPLTCLTRHFGATPAAVSTALVELVSALRAQDVPAQAVEDLQIVLAEVFNNIAEHAYGNGHEGQISVEVFSCATCLCCRIRDTGREMPGLALPEGALPSNTGPLEDLPEGGFGWFMIHQITSDLAYERSDNLNTLRFQVLFDT